MWAQQERQEEAMLQQNIDHALDSAAAAHAAKKMSQPTPAPTTSPTTSHKDDDNDDVYKAHEKSKRRFMTMIKVLERDALAHASFSLRSAGSKNVEDEMQVFIDQLEAPDEVRDLEIG